MVPQLTTLKRSILYNSLSLSQFQIFGEEMEEQADGKPFKKLLLGDYKWITYREMDQKLDLIGKGLMSLGVRPRQNVVIFAETRMEWMLAAQVSFHASIGVES